MDDKSKRESSDKDDRGVSVAPIIGWLLKPSNMAIVKKLISVLIELLDALGVVFEKSDRRGRNIFHRASGRSVPGGGGQSSVEETDEEEEALSREACLEFLSVLAASIGKEVSVSPGSMQKILEELSVGVELLKRKSWPAREAEAFMSLWGLLEGSSIRLASLLEGTSVASSGAVKEDDSE